LSRTFGCVRYVYNWALRMRSEAYTLHSKKTGYAETDRALTVLKKQPETAFLAKVSSVPLQQALRHLQTAFVAFFAKRAKYPRFKSRKKSRASATARAISDAAWTDLRSMLEYKCAWYGRDLVVADRWFPSSKLCGNCGSLREKLPLNVRTWTCGCGAMHDRDVNAARNLLAAGLAES
jgi:transposase